MRALVVVGAVALTLLPPAVTFGAPPPGFRAATLPQAPPRAAASHSASRDSFKLPFHLDAGPKPAEDEINPTFLPFDRWGAWPVAPRYVWLQPTWLQNGCFSNNAFGTPSTLQSAAYMPAGTTIGSLVDDRSKDLISSTPSYNPISPSSANAATMSNPVGLQYQLQPTLCGSSSLFNL